MTQRTASALVLSIGLVATAAILRSAPDAHATAPGDAAKIVSFHVERINPGETVVMGQVPANRTLVIKDLFRTASAGGGLFSILADGEPIFPGILRFDSSDLPWSLAAGLPVSAGKEAGRDPDGERHRGRELPRPGRAAVGGLARTDGSGPLRVLLGEGAAPRSVRPARSATLDRCVIRLRSSTARPQRVAAPPCAA